MLNPQEGLHIDKLSKNNLLTWTQKPTEKKDRFRYSWKTSLKYTKSERLEKLKIQKDKK